MANKTTERCTVVGQIEHYRNCCRDLEVKLVKHSEMLEEAMARKTTLQVEINEIEARIAAAEAMVSRMVPLPMCRLPSLLLLLGLKRWMKKWTMRALKSLGLVLATS